MQRGKTGTARKIPGATFINTALAALVIPIWLAALAAWAVQLGGLAAVQKAQGGRFLQFDWFVTAFDIVVLGLMFFHLLARRSTPGIVALKAIVTVLEILRTNVWNDARLGRDIAGQNYLRIDSQTNPGLTASTIRTNVLFGGYLATAAIQCLLILALGNLPAYSGQDNEFLANKGKQGAEHLDTNQRGSQIHPDKSGLNNGTDFPSVENNGVNGNVGSNGGRHHVPNTHLYETQEADGLQGPTYIDNGRSNV